jgi:hypothetical protein
LVSVWDSESRPAQYNEAFSLNQVVKHILCNFSFLSQLAGCFLATYHVLKELLCSNSNLDHEKMEGEVGGGERKKSQGIGCEMVDPDLKCAFERNNPLSTGYGVMFFMCLNESVIGISISSIYFKLSVSLWAARCT